MISGISHYNVNLCAGDELGVVADDHIYKNQNPTVEHPTPCMTYYIYDLHKSDLP